MHPRRRTTTFANDTSFQVLVRDEEGSRKWMDYPRKAAAQLTQGYATGKEDVEIKLMINGYVNVYTCNFRRMEQKSLSTSKIRKIRPPYESSKYNADGGTGGEGLAGEDAEDEDVVNRASVAPFQMDPKKSKKDQVKALFEKKKNDPNTTADIMDWLISEAEGAGSDKKILDKMTTFRLAISALEQALADGALADLAARIKACEKAGAGKDYINNAKTLASQAKVAVGRKLIAKALEKTREIKGKSKDELEEMHTSIVRTLDEVMVYDLGEEELRACRDRRRKIWNALQDLRGAIRVYCRTRPANQRELDKGFKSAIQFHPDLLSVTLTNEDGDESDFSFDRTFCPGSQTEVFDEVKDLVQSVYDGYNVTIFAYGQTGSGKTYTMYGPTTSESLNLNDKDSGVVIRSITEMFKLKQQYDQTSAVKVEVSMIELYLQKLTDLLFNDSTKPPTINIRKGQDGVFFDGATSLEVKTSKELWKLVTKAFESRKVTATAMNSESSRSHLLLNLNISLVNNTTQQKTHGKMLMVDLAGSERVKDSLVEGNALQEAIEINKSLTALGDVMETLVMPKKAQQVSYRNSKLTECLQDCLGGTAKAILFAMVSPAQSNLVETLMTLKWASRANKVVNLAPKEGEEKKKTVKKPSSARNSRK